MFDWLDWDKLKREWKTVAIAVAGIVIQGYDLLVASGAIDLPSLFPLAAQPYISPAFLVLMLLLRQWKDAQE